MATNWCACGRMPGSPSIAPRRTITISPVSGSRANSADPHSPQKVLESPPGGVQSRRCSSPAISLSEPGASFAEAWAAVPLRRWQRVQWQ